MAWYFGNPFSKGLFSDKKKGSGLDYPGAPQFQEIPEVAESYRTLLNLGKGLTSSTVEGLPQILQDTVSFNPQTTQLALEAMRAQLAPSYRNSQQNLTNTLEANNQLTGSTTASAFGNLEADYLSQLTAAQAQAGIADIDRALNNRVGLYGTGLNTINAAGGLALNDQNQKNNFAIQNYENQIAEFLGEQPAQTGGLQGALTGAAGGAMAGLATGNPYIAAGGAALGAYSGYSGQPGTGGSFLQAGMGLYGQTRPIQLQTLGANQGLQSAGGEQIFNTLLNQQNGANSYYKYGLS